MGMQFEKPWELITPIRRVIIAGPDDFDDYKFLKQTMDELTYWFENVHVIRGGGGRRVERRGDWTYIGADHLAKRWAEARWYLLSTVWPDPDKKPKEALLARNKEMCQYAMAGETTGLLAAFWDGDCEDTEDLMAMAKRQGLKVKTIKI